MVKDREAYCAAVHGVVKCWALMSDCITTAISYSKKRRQETNMERVSIEVGGVVNKGSCQEYLQC